VNHLTSENKSVKQELENLKIDHDTLVQQRVSHNARIQNLQREIEDEKDKALKISHVVEVLLQVSLSVLL
jgi:chromosome segregation ATPase